MKHFILGLMLGSVAPAAAQINCTPPPPRCENALKMHFERGYIPNRCKIT